MDAVMLE